MTTETANAGDGPAERRVRPVAWTLRAELAARETTCSAHMWFSDPVNSAWAPIYNQAALDAAVAAERSEWAEIVTQLIACHDEPDCPAVALARAKLNA